MRQTRIALILSAVTLAAAPTVHAQIAHTETAHHHGCPTCQAASPCPTCSDGCGLIPSLGATFHYVLDGLSIGCDGRHKVYKAALRRNVFDKKYLLPVPYYTHILPMYSPHRCCRGPVVPSAACPTCGPHEVMGEEVLEMREVPGPLPAAPALPAEPTPAAEPAAAIGPDAVMPGQAVPYRPAHTRSKPRAGALQEHRAARPSGEVAPTPDKVARIERESPPQSSGLRQFITTVLRPITPDRAVQPASAVQKTTSEP